MAAQPASPVPTISPAEMQILISRAGLMLNPGQMADLVLAWRQVAGLIASIPPKHALIDDAAFSFRLPSPAGAAGAVRVERRPADTAMVAAPARQRAATEDRGSKPAKPTGRAVKAAGKKSAVPVKRPAKSATKSTTARSRAVVKSKTKAAARKPGSGRR